MKNHEYELKLMLSEKEYKALKEYAVSWHIQKNYYFDNNDFEVYKHKHSLRIREKNEQYEITFKSGQDEKDQGVLSMVEENQTISKTDFHQIMQGQKTIADYINLPYDGLINIGCLTTKRTLLKFNEHMPLAELDCNTYKKYKDYELEWEISHNLYDEAIDFLNGLHITIENRTTGLPKFVRYIKSLTTID